MIFGSPPTLQIYDSSPGSELQNISGLLACTCSSMMLSSDFPQLIISSSWCCCWCWCSFHNECRLHCPSSAPLQEAVIKTMQPIFCGIKRHVSNYGPFASFTICYKWACHHPTLLCSQIPLLVSGLWVPKLRISLGFMAWKIKDAFYEPFWGVCLFFKKKIIAIFWKLKGSLTQSQNPDNMSVSVPQNFLVK